MIYCVVPQALESELYEKLKAYYADDPNVEVIIDRRGGPDRRKAMGAADHDERREIRDRRKRRVTGTFPSTHSPE